eukprot:CAMPEP_0181209572 /NCGR_PEP_ID=MMETSP1096-20121128/22742_1 /TAXON_ID=156174 ORGANISM="Chrysochromulina ericina, Strain CCMP281" /NCGR_SAMPLE_ID=MMETSP1096 /ASSEMBLY_ACC=CAM_ASM_000453 /LENGTH=99 /DNA_ID=CAMNT_0023300751 /DNA_START=44 /DNA_END=341 /DNA_ORIENTATION=-
MPAMLLAIVPLWWFANPSLTYLPEMAANPGSPQFCRKALPWHHNFLPAAAIRAQALADFFSGASMWSVEAMGASAAASAGPTVASGEAAPTAGSPSSTM